VSNEQNRYEINKNKKLNGRKRKIKIEIFKEIVKKDGPQESPCGVFCVVDA
jgi:hypothetical protein